MAVQRAEGAWRVGRTGRRLCGAAACAAAVVEGEPGQPSDMKRNVGKLGARDRPAPQRCSRSASTDRPWRRRHRGATLPSAASTTRASDHCANRDCVAELRPTGNIPDAGDNYVVPAGRWGQPDGTAHASLHVNARVSHQVPLDQLRRGGARRHSAIYGLSRDRSCPSDARLQSLPLCIAASWWPDCRPRGAAW